MTPNELVALLPLVKRLAARFQVEHAHSVDLADLMGAAVLGMCSAGASYDNKRGVKFSSYAYKRIQGAMLDYVATELKHTNPARRATAALLEIDLRDQPESSEVLPPDPILKSRLASLWLPEYELLRDIYLRGLTLRQIAHRDGVQASTVMRRRDRILLKLKAEGEAA